MLQNWRNQPIGVRAPDDDQGVFVVADIDKSLPPTPGPSALPSIAQLAFPSPDESSSPSNSSNGSHEPCLDLTKCDLTALRHPNKLKKPPPSSYPFSFIPENPSPRANFPYAFHRHRSTHTSPAASFVAPAARSLSTLSMTPIAPPRKLTKRRPSIPEPPPTAAADLSMARIAEQPPLRRSNTFNFNSLRRKKSSPKTTQSEDSHRTLPALPPPSPLTLNIPTFRPFHARKRDSWHVESTSQPPSNSGHSSPPAANELISEVAWTGASKALDSILRVRGGFKSTWSLQDEDPPPRRARSKPEHKFTLGPDEAETESPSGSLDTGPSPPFLRRNATERNTTVQSSKRRWTLAMALADEGISDELLVEKLEALRTRSRAASLIDSDVDDVAEWDGMWAAYDDELDADEPPPPLPPKDTTLDHAQRTVSMPALPSHSTETWKSARRALLTCRELVRTERHYLASLNLLLSGNTRKAPPPLMCAYAAALARESAGLLQRMEDDPSAWGVAAAFVGAEDGLEAALVAWCGVVGGWFVDGDAGGGGRTARRLNKMRTRSVQDKAEGSASSTVDLQDGSKEKLGSKKRRGSMGLLSLGSGLSLSSEPPSPVSATSRTRSKRERDARPAVRDLAIGPTQRVMRYVLLYQDLLDHTPVSSPSRVLVARAVDAAIRIAQRCDRAQGNAAFLQRQ
ncbi:hypothetical protein K438DRAFT_1954616 [Mycena galopus ATCC 62051]|nr:hypothetical protein K438DRAFT_1954616 [Mycena galopus ATCC 62051]